ncbi:dentin sialophosphoprotein-like [Mytilus trossulus]|uniref:dentin sialophosphoprotein-like n=1 Tax=Mytilus trossulus TaxID=6551 RepID=UPI003004F947
MKITGPMTPKQLNMFQVLVRDQEFKQKIEDARRIAQECLKLDFKDYRSKNSLKSDRKYESTNESGGDKLRATENKETQTVHTVDASVQTENEKTVSTDKLTTLMLDALANVPDHAVGYIKDFLQLSLKGIINIHSTKTNLNDQPCQRCISNVFSKPNYDNIDFETRMEPVAANIIDVCTNQMENIARNIFEEMMYDHFDHTHEWNENQLATPMPPSTKYYAPGSNVYVPNSQRSDFNPTCMSHPSEFSYYTTIDAVPYNWAANAPDQYSDLADDEYFRENLIVPKLDLSFMNENHPVNSDTESSMLSLSTCESEGAFKNWLKRNEMYESEDTSSASLSICNVPREDTLNVKEQAVVKRRILERVNKNMMPDDESEIDEIFTENDNYKQEETRRSDVSMGFIKADIDLTSAEVNDFTKPKESQDVLQVTETKDEAPEAGMAGHQGHDIEPVDERRVIKAAKWVLAVDTFMQQQKEQKESNELCRIEHTRYFDLGSSRSSMSSSTNIEPPPMITSDTFQDKRDSLGTIIGIAECIEGQLNSDTSQDKSDNLGTSIRDKECYEEQLKSDTPQDKKDNLGTSIKDNEEQLKLSDTIEDHKQMKEIVNQKSNILSNSDCVSLDSLDIDIASILGSDFGKGEGDTVSFNEAPKPVEPVEKPLFRKPPLPPNAYKKLQAFLRERAKQKDIEDSESEESTESTNNVTNAYLKLHAILRERAKQKDIEDSVSEESTESTNNVTSNRKRRCDDEYSDDETDSSTSDTDCTDNYSYESDFSEETYESDSFCGNGEPDNGNNEMNDITKDSNIQQGLITHENVKGSKESLQDIYTQKDFSTPKGDLSPENEYSEKLSASLKFEIKNNANKHDIKESSMQMPIEQYKQASTTESQFISNIGGDGNPELYVKKENSFKLTKYKNDNERCTGFTEPSTTNLVDMVANETEISKFSKSHNNTESVDQKVSSNMDVSNTPISTKSQSDNGTSGLSVRQRRIGHNNLLRKK